MSIQDRRTDREKIRGKVAAIITPTSLVINRGRVDGVRKDMKFGIYFSIGPIHDPDDPTNLIRELTFRKGTVTVSSVYDKMCYCSVEPNYAKSSFIPFPTQREAVYPNVEKPLFSDQDWTIRVGDLAEELLEQAPKK